MGKNWAARRKPKGEQGVSPLASKHRVLKRPNLQSFWWLGVTSNPAGSFHMGRSRRREIKKKVKPSTPCFTVPQTPTKPSYTFLFRGGWLINS